MSYILEALKKSSEERARLVPADTRPDAVAAPVRDEARADTPAARRWIVGGALMALVAVGIVAFGMRTPEPKPVIPAQSSPPPAASDSAAPLELAAARSEAAPASPTAKPVEAMPKSGKSADSSTATASAAPKKISPESTAAPSAAEETRPPARTKAKAKPQEEAPAETPAADAPAVRPEVHAAPAPAPAAAPVGAEMPADLMQQVRAVPIAIHIYSEKPADRMIIVNGRAVREGGSLSSGMTIERITPSGVVVSYQGYQASRQVP